MSCRSRSLIRDRDDADLDGSLDREERRRQKRLEKQALKDGSLFGYTDESNPFGDRSLSNVFIWNKKHKKELTSGSKSSLKKVEKKLKKRQLELRDEIQRIKLRKEEREIEKEQMEEMKAMMSREMEKEINANWDQKEEEFHREQNRIRVTTRIKERRATPCDLLANNLFILDYEEIQARSRGHADSLGDIDNVLFDLVEPTALLKGLDKSQLEQLLREIQEQVDLNQNAEYWAALDVVCNDELTSLSSPMSSMVDPVRADLEAMFLTKTADELRELKNTAIRKISGQDDDQDVIVDVDYWQSLLSMMDAAIAHAFLREFYANLLRLRMQHLTAKSQQGRLSREAKFEDWSPITYWDAYDDRIAITPAQDMEILERARRQVLLEQYGQAVANRVHQPVTAPAQPELSQRLELLANGEMGEDEEAFGDVVQLPEVELIWAAKYKPRKPKFFNCVKSGFEWSKYNQTHYDRDNPPPKVVQGYKFNLFYPDLLDPTIPPTFRKEKIPDDPNFCILRFSAGPPYQDIAFKIVNKRWESSQRHGFRCKFERGILHLYFNFRRIRYRR